MGVILSSCQRLQITPPAEWQDTMAASFLTQIDNKDKVSMMRSDFFVKPLVGLAGMGWKPSPQQWQVRFRILGLVFVLMSGGSLVCFLSALEVLLVCSPCPRYQ